MSTSTRRHPIRLWAFASLLPFFACMFIPTVSLAEDSLCAEVKIEIHQELTLERQAFDAHMRINNGLDNISLENVSVSVSFADEDGNSLHGTSDPNDTGASFFIRLDSLSGINDVSGRGSVAPSTSADIHWLIIPAPGTGGEAPSGTLYMVGATLEYNMGGEDHTIEVSPDYIYVKPMPMLTLDYFLTHEVNADDSFTPEIEPAEPFTLGVRIKNNGHGSARSLKINSARPRIVENNQGLLIGFEIIGSTVNGEPSEETLLVDFGDIPAQESIVARWQMIATLAGTFVDFEASFTHADELGGELTSLIDATNAHLLLGDVRVDLPGRDEVRDFLVEDEDGYDLNLMSVASTDEIIGEGHSLVVVALVGDELHIRIFDVNGEMVVDKAENELISGEDLANLNNLLTTLPDESSLEEQKQEIIGYATSSAGHTHEDGLRVYESSGVDTAVQNRSDGASISDEGGGSYRLRFSGGEGFAYVKVTDPSNGTMQASVVRRSDGKRLPAENIWFSRTRQEGVGTWDYYINLFDSGSTGDYLLTLEERPDIPQPPVFQFIPDRAVGATHRMSFLVRASDPNGSIPSLGVTSLPEGATFEDRGDGSGVFDWIPSADQVGTHLVRFAATDGVSETAETPQLTVCPSTDSDCDGMDDSWELEHFGSLARDGTGDFDGDGVLDLDEFLNGTDPAEIVQIVDVPLYHGFNLFAYPLNVMVEHATCSGLIDALGGPAVVSSLDRMNPVTQQYERCNPVEGIDFVIQTGRGYTLELSGDQTLRVEAVATCPTIQLQPGDNLVGHPWPSAGLTCYEWLTAEGADDLDAIRRFNERGRYESCTWIEVDGQLVPSGEDFPIQLGEGYFLRSIDGGTLVLPGCEEL